MKGIKILVLLITFALIQSEPNNTNNPDDNNSNEENDPKSKDNIQLSINNILSEFHYENRTDISLDEFIKVFHRFITKDIPQDNSANATSYEDDAFLRDLTAKIIAGLPNTINVKDISDYISPERIEKIFNELLGDMDLANVFDKDSNREEESNNDNKQEVKSSKPQATEIKLENERTDL